MRRLLTGLAAVALSAAACTNTPEVVTPSRSSLAPPTTEQAPDDEREVSTTASTRSTDRDTASSSTDGSTTSGSSTTTGGSTAVDPDPDVSSEDPQTNDREEATETLAPPASTDPNGRLVGSYVVEVVATAPHDPGAYTQGLELHDGRLLESTGTRGVSDRRWTDPVSGDVIAAQSIGADLFGEGITVVGDQAYQLTYTAELVIILDLATLTEQRVLRYEGEGWGLCHDGTELAMSNGTDVLTFRDPETFDVTRHVPVRLNGDAVGQLNELECANGQVLANVYGIDQIVAIDPATGDVEAVIDAAAIRPDEAPSSDFNYVLNGIAHRADTGTFYLTGKWWPTMFEVRFVPA